jgi:hypothetical protein
MECLILVAEKNGPTMMARIGVMRALIRVATFGPDGNGTFQAIELPDSEIAEHQQAIESAAIALRKWRDEIQSGSAAEDAPEPPTPPEPDPPPPEPPRPALTVLA